MINKKRVIEHQYFWITLAVISILILVSLINPGRTGALTGAQALDYNIQTIAYEPAGGELYFEVKVDGVKSLNVHFAETVKDAVIRVEELKTVKWFKGDVYSYFKVSSAEAKKISSWDFVLKIKETDLKKVWLKKNEVKLYANGKELFTTIEKEEDGYVFYKAVSKEIGEFVIGKAAPIIAKEEIKPLKEIPVEEVMPTEIPAETFSEEIISPEETAEEIIVSKTVEQPTPAVAGEDFWIKIKNFFKKLFV